MRLSADQSAPGYHAQPLLPHVVASGEPQSDSRLPALTERHN
jgi:hypothetical protein